MMCVSYFVTVLSQFLLLLLCFSFFCFLFIHLLPYPSIHNLNTSLRRYMSAKYYTISTSFLCPMIMKIRYCMTRGRQKTKNRGNLQPCQLVAIRRTINFTAAISLYLYQKVSKSIASSRIQKLFNRFLYWRTI